MSTINVLFRLRVHSCFASVSSEDVTLEHSCALPCAPFYGMGYSYGEMEISIGTSPFADDQRERAEIIWKPEEHRFVVYLEDFELYNAELHKKQGRPLAEIVEEYTSMGWQREKT